MSKRLTQMVADALLLKLLGMVERIDREEGRKPIPRPDIDDGHSIMRYAEQVHNRAMHEEGCEGCGVCDDDVIGEGGYWN